MTTLAVGIGNPSRRDDRVGLVVSRFLRMHGHDAILAGTTPEAYAGLIRRREPDTILLIDAVHMGEAPGHVELLTEHDLEVRPAWNTHRPPLSLLMRYLSLDTGARVLLLGIQPGETGWGHTLTPAVRAGVRRAISMAMRELAGNAAAGGRSCDRQEYAAAAPPKSR